MPNHPNLAGFAHVLVFRFHHSPRWTPETDPTERSWWGLHETPVLFTPDSRVYIYGNGFFAWAFDNFVDVDTVDTTEPDITCRSPGSWPGRLHGLVRARSARR